MIVSITISHVAAQNIGTYWSDLSLFDNFIFLNLYKGRSINWLKLYTWWVSNIKSTISVVVAQEVAGLSNQQIEANNTDTMADMIAEGLAGGGFGWCCGCKKQNESYLLDRYYQHCNYSGSNLTRAPLPDSNLSTRLAYVLTGNTEYLSNGSLRYDSQCFPTNAVPKCSWSQSIKDLGEDVFPRFAVSVACSGCKYTNITCDCPFSKVSIETCVLRRQTQCDSSGFDLWEPVREVLVVGCSCYSRS